MARHPGTLILAALAAALAAGCAHDLRASRERLDADTWRIRVDRCAVADEAVLHADLAEQAAHVCGADAELERIESVPSRQGSLFGECLHAGALQAQVRCAG